MWHMLIEIALDEGDVGQALSLLPELKGWYSRNYHIRVAQAAETSHPEAALNIYDLHVHDLIAARGRGNYQDAARYLTRMREIYASQGQRQDWPAYIGHVRQENHNLPALRDELNKAGL